MTPGSWLGAYQGGVVRDFDRASPWLHRSTGTQERSCATLPRRHWQRVPGWGKTVSRSIFPETASMGTEQLGWWVSIFVIPSWTGPLVMRRTAERREARGPANAGTGMRREGRKRGSLPARPVQSQAGPAKTSLAQKRRLQPARNSVLKCASALRRREEAEEPPSLLTDEGNYDARES